MTDGKSQGASAAEFLKSAVENAAKPRSGKVPVRPYPRGIELETQTDDRLEFRLKSVHRRWRFAAVWIFIVSLFLVPLLGVWLGFDDGFRTDRWGNNAPMVRPSFSFVPSIILALLTIAGMVWAWFKGHPKIEIVATPSTLTVAGLEFDRANFSGMRIGYQIQGEAVKIGTFDTVMGDHFMGVSGLRVGYGRWGEDLDYMVNKYHAPEYVVWMNEQIEQVGRPESKSHAPAEGRVTETF